MIRHKFRVGLPVVLLALAVLWLVGSTEQTTRVKFWLFRQKRQEALASLNMLEIADKPQMRFWLRVLGPETVMDDLLLDSGGGRSLDCHSQAHFIGRISYQLYGARAFGKRISVCHSGYPHGAMEAFLQERGTANLAEEMARLCRTLNTNFGQFECWHGVGHGVLAFQDYDLPEAVALCGQLPDIFSEDSCLGGVFMENIMTATGKGADPAHTTEWVGEAPHFPCSYFSDNKQVQTACYHMQTSRMLLLYGNDFDRVLQECLQAPKDMQPACFRSFGRDVAGDVLRDPARIVSLCSKVSPKVFVDECVIGSLNVIVDFWGERLAGQASDFCRALPQQHKSTCYTTLSSRLAGLFTSSAQARSVCSTFEPDYQHLCRATN